MFRVKAGWKGWAVRKFLPKGMRMIRLGSWLKRDLKPLSVTGSRDFSYAPGTTKIQEEVDWTPSPGNIKEHLNVQLLIRAYQDRGHLYADLDPLEITRTRHKEIYEPPKGLLPEETLPKNYGKRVEIPINCFVGGDQRDMTVREMVRRLNVAYCGSVGVEMAHSTSLFKSQWVREVCEKPDALNLQVNRFDRQEGLERLVKATHFETFLAKKWPSEKRFGLEGCESLIPGLLNFIDKSAISGIKIINIAMAHRGRLNILANVLQVPLDKLFAQFREVEVDEHGSGDVKYHLGTSVTLTNSKTQQPLVIALVANASHLESPSAVAIGKTKAQQVFLKDEEGDQVLSIIIHGDAAMCGQGVVYETFHLSNLPCYSTNGTIHVVINNQIGFTTDPRFSRSSDYCTDVAKVIGAPIFHVNADDVDAVLFVMSVAAKYRQEFKSDVVVDLIGYRKNGHNEAEEPMLTQPLMYKKIRKLTPVLEKYKKKILEDAVTTKEDVQKLIQDFETELENKFQEATKIRHYYMDEWLDSPWDGYFKDKIILKEPETGLNKLWIEGIASRMTQQPNIGIHPDLIKMIRGRNDMVNDNKIDWTIAELVTFATLLGEGVHVRLSGRDVEQGYYNRRNHIYYSIREFGKEFCPLDHVGAVQSIYSICNSSLCEYAIAGFELGYSTVTPYQLILWECQSGDYANNAQCIIDQYLSCGESKWKRQCGVVFLLPHGLDGQGPENSSGRPERFLQLCGDDETKLESDPMKQLKDCNMVVANVSHPANLFHILRRQVKIVFRKPLVLFTPKDLIKHPDFISTYEAMDIGTKFQTYISDPVAKTKRLVSKLILCTGKMYYELNDERKKRNLVDKIALSRIEQFSPFPYTEVLSDRRKYPEAKLYWAQEEPRNQGWWEYVRPRVMTALGETDYEILGYIGRKSSPAPAARDYTTHLAERREFLNDAMEIPLTE